ncbi:hypothetical protein GH714_018724 [Hevea brasiliensis]|uniref:Uncharacterized protein n=1 Tax=Hevea brasiliensis TaxID=3981 RepID=A0A6A6M3H1_HEVBR|nr:hypothetical protein GH714_018724 [Hevea brasiliensis]
MKQQGATLATPNCWVLPMVAPSFVQPALPRQSLNTIASIDEAGPSNAGISENAEVADDVNNSAIDVRIQYHDDVGTSELDIEHESNDNDYCINDEDEEDSEDEDEFFVTMMTQIMMIMVPI